MVTLGVLVTLCVFIYAMTRKKSTAKDTSNSICNTTARTRHWAFIEEEDEYILKQISGNSNALLSGAGGLQMISLPTIDYHDDLVTITAGKVGLELRYVEPASNITLSILGPSGATKARIEVPVALLLSGLQQRGLIEKKPRWRGDWEVER